MRVKSSSLSRTPASCAMASRCSTALVEPPSAITTVMAFSNERRVRISRGFKPSRTSLTTASPARRQSERLSSPTASCAELPGKDKRSEEHTSELQSQSNLVCRLLLEKKTQNYYRQTDTDSDSVA